jgi:hypothetical protein
MAEIAWCVQLDLELMLGGAANLIQLTDKDGDGVADAPLVAALLARGNAEASSAVQVQSDLSSFTAPYPTIVINAAAAITAYYTWLQSTSGVAIPDGAKELYQDALRVLDQIAKRERTLATTTQPAGTNQAVKQIDPDPLGNRITRDSMKGFW